MSIKKLMLVTLLLIVLGTLVSVASMQDTVTLTGWFNVVHGDPAPDSNEAGTMLVTLEDANGTPIAYLQTDYAAIRAYGREYVQVSGLLVEEAGKNAQLSAAPTVQVTSIQPLGNMEELITGSQPWVNVLCKFSDITSEPKPASAYQQFFSASAPGLDHYWRAISYNMINLVGSQTVSRWYTLPRPRSYYVPAGSYANLDALAADCTAAADADVYYPTFVGINIMVNDVLDCCAWGGSNTMTLDGVTKNYRMTWDPPWAQTHSVLAHETGHGFELPHSSGPADNPPSELSIYVSQWDVMSDAGGTCFNYDVNLACIGQGVIAPYVADNGWIPANRISTVNPGQDVTVTIDRLQEPINTTGMLLARVPINGSSSLFYSVEVRDVSSGYDVNIPAQAVIIHKYNLALTGNTGPALVVDAADGNDNVNDAGGRWLPGELYFDPLQNIRIEVLSQSGSSFTVRIRNNVATGNPVDLAATINGSPSPYVAGSGLTFNFSVLNQSANQAANATAIINLPTNTGISVVSKPAYCSQAGSTLTCALGTLAGGATVNGTIALSTSIITSGSVPMTITVYADQSDTNTANNVATARLTDLANDTWDTAKVIAALPYTDRLNTGGALAINEPTPTCSTGIGNTVWYRYTPPVTQTTRIDTLTSNFDTSVAVYTYSGGTWTQVACDDDSGGNYTSLITTALTGGVTYYLQVGGWGGDSGNLVLNVQTTGPTPTWTNTATRTNTPTPTYTHTPTPTYTHTPTRTLPPYLPPVPVSPTGTITDTNPTFTWSGVGQLAWYYLWIDAPNGHIFDQWYDGWTLCGGTTCSVTPTLDLLGGTYTWWVQQWTTQDGYSLWSNAAVFTVDAPPPVAVPVAPLGTTTATQPTFTWTGIDGYAWYQLWVSGPDGGVLAQWYESTAICVGATCSVTPPLNLVGGTYRWWAQLWTPALGYSAWSSDAVFMVTLPPAAPTPIAPSGTTSATQPTFTWSRVTAATWYYLWVSGPSGHVLDQWYQDTVCSGATCVVTPALTLPNGVYQWWVQAWSPEGSYGAWSAGQSFTVNAPIREVAPPEISGDPEQPAPTAEVNPVTP